jgi:LuxR family maltose regulon positive regulatory protein
LWCQLERARRAQVVLIAAPAGYGKSTLITQWAAAQHDPTVAWVQLDSADNDPTRLWSHLMTALQRAGCVVDVNASEFVAGNAGAILDRVVPRVVAALADHGRPLTIILDDCHVLRSAACSEQLDRLLELLPAPVGVVLVSRSDPRLRLGRLRVEGRLAEIRTADLAFTTDEAAELLAGHDIDLSEAVLAELVEATEGWPAALYLAALSLAGRTEPDDFVHQLSGSDRFIADYLSEEVLGRLEPELRDFILAMSVFDRFNVALANEVLQTGSAYRLLQQLERTNLFVIPLHGGGWFRFHHLFRTFARSALEVEHPDRVPELHRRGARWFSDHDLVEDAVQHLLVAGDSDEAAALIQATWARFFDAGRVATVTRWLDRLRGSPADRGAAATVVAAWMAALTGDQAQMRRRLAMLESMDSDSALPDGTTSPQSAMLLVRGLFGFDGPDQLLADARGAARLENNPASPWYAVACTALGHAGYLTGDDAAARPLLTAAATSPVAPRTVQILADAIHALLEAEHGNTALSRRYAQQAMTTVADHGMEAMPQSLPAFTASGVALAADGQLAEAMDLFQAGLRTRRRAPGLSPWPLIHHLIAMAALARRLGDLDYTEELLAEVDTLTPWSDDTMALTRARMALARRPAGPAGDRAPDPARPDNRGRSRASTPSGDPGRSTEVPAVGDPLTPREQEILHRLTGTQTLREIAADLYVSHNTVKTITLSLYRKLGAHSRAEAVAIARKAAAPRRA